MATTPDPDRMAQRLDDLEEGIEATRRQAQADGLLPDGHHERTLADPDGDGDDEGGVAPAGG